MTPADRFLRRCCYIIPILFTVALLLRVSRGSPLAGDASVSADHSCNIYFALHTPLTSGSTAKTLWFGKHNAKYRPSVGKGT
jgi:hypothetical protein